MEQQMQITLSSPGKKVPLPQNLESQLKNLNFRFKNRLSFFGGHPVSMNRQHCNHIFTQRNQHTGNSPYLVCQKTDGVRYILLITRQKNYMISRQGSKNVCAYQVNCKLGKNWAKFQNLGLEPDLKPYKQIFQLLDGQLIQDTDSDGNSQFRYLIFDVLIHFGLQVTKEPLNFRLQFISKFTKCNEFLLSLIPPSKSKNIIEIKMKDFFRLSITKFNVTQFLLKHYIKLLPHQNDGLIFNHQNKQYIFGQNDGYIKWKPPHLNTVDFLVVPNQELTNRFKSSIIDLYLGYNDKEQSGTYLRIFYNFAVVTQQTFDEINRLTEQRLNEHLDNQDRQTTDYFVGVIAQCKYEESNPNQKQVFKQMFQLSNDPQQIRQSIAKKGQDAAKQVQIIKSLQKSIYNKCWRIFRLRNDKHRPNDLSIARRIEQSIKDNITQQEVIKRNKQFIKPQHHLQRNA